MNFRFSKHADREMARRGISRDTVEGVLAAPAQPEHGVIVHYHGGWRSTESLICARHGNGTASPPTVVTVYRTSKIEKYWRITYMKVTYDPEVDMLRIVFRDMAIEENDEDKPA